MLYPVANAFCTPPDANTEDGLRKCAAALMNRAGELRSEVDGISIQSLNTYRVQSPLFRFTLPQNNIFGADPGCYLLTQPCSPSLTFDAVSDGYWIMLAPLPAGQHTVHFSAKLPSLSFAVDVTYNLTVG